MSPADEANLLAHLKFELDSLYVGTEVVQSPKYKEYPIDGMLYDACLLHFRVVWDFFYGGGQGTDFTIRDILSNTAIRNSRPKAPKRLREIRAYLNVMLAHLSHERIHPDRKAQEPHMTDFAFIRKHTEDLFNGFVSQLTPHQKSKLVNQLSNKFKNYKTLEP
jgi:hypothetical protein